MKEVEELVVTVCDFGSFISMAEKLSETCAKVNYHAPIDREFRDIDDALIGYGIPNVHKIEDFMDPDVVKETDLYCFPDIGYGGHQRYLRTIGKPVWGSNGADEYERLRTKFVKKVKELGLPMVQSDRIKGLDNLSAFLKDKTDKWVKINEFRNNQETFYFQDYVHALPTLRRLYVKFGGASNLVWFVVQDPIDDATEIGYDGWSVDGWFPDSSYAGYEKKNELYLGAMTPYDDLPEGVREVNEAWSKVLEEAEYRNFIATEIRNKDGVPNFIDPTQRMPGQTGEQLLETLLNLAEVIWKGAQGELIQPKWAAKFAASATLHYCGDCEDEKVMVVKPEGKRWAKLCRYGIVDGVCHFPPNKREDTGVVIAMGDTIEETIQGIHDNFEAIGDRDVRIKPEGFVDLLRDIQQAEEEGIEFTKEEVPEPESVLEN